MCEAWTAATRETEGHSYSHQSQKPLFFDGFGCVWEQKSHWVGVCPQRHQSCFSLGENCPYLKITGTLLNPRFLFYWLRFLAPHRTRPMAFWSWLGLPEYLKRSLETNKILRTSVTVTDSVCPVTGFKQSPSWERTPTSWSQMPIILGMFRGFNAFKSVSCLSPLNFSLLWIFGSFQNLSLSSFVALQTD